MSKAFLTALFGALLSLASCDPEPPEPPLEPVIDERSVVDGYARFTILTPRLIRLEYAERREFEDRPTQTLGVRPTATAPFETRVNEEGERVIETEALTLTYRPGSGPFSPENLRIELSRGAERILAQPEWGIVTRDEDTLGGWRRGLDNRGSRQVLHPGVLSRRGWYLLDDSESALLTDSEIGFEARPEREGYQDGYFFGYGLDYRAALADLRALTGAAPLLPKKALGVWFSRYWPYSAADWAALLAEFRSHAVPLDIISVDTDWKETPESNICDTVNAITGAPEGSPCSWNGWGWNPTLYPDPSAFLAWAHENGLEVGLNIHPSINAADPRYPSVIEAVGALDRDTASPPCSVLQADLAHTCEVFDWADPRHLAAYFELHRPIGEAGVDFWWLDWCCEGSHAVAPGLTADTWINARYAAEHRAMGSRWPAFSRLGGSFQEDVDLPSAGRGAFAEHRSTLHFTGDTCGTWEMLAFTAELTVSEAAIGLPYVSHDIGSFLGPPPPGEACAGPRFHDPRLSDEMYVRWVQMGTFQPLDRLHSQHGDRLPWEYPGEAERIASEFLRLRARLVPHLYTLSREAHDTGLPMARALYLSWPDQAEAYEHPAEFTLGDDLLIATVAVEGDPARVELWIPPGTWIDYFTGERVEGPTTLTREVPLEAYPVFARAGSILPTQPDLLTSSAGPQDGLTLTAWAGGEGEYSLYEDEGRGTAHEAGALRRTSIRLATPSAGCHLLTIAAAEGAAFIGALDSREWTVELIGAGDPSAVSIGAEALPLGDLTPGWSYDAASARVTIRTGARATDADAVLRVGAGCP